MYTEKLWATSPTKLKLIMDLGVGDSDYWAQIHEHTQSTDDLTDMVPYGWIEIGTVDHQHHLELTDTQTQAAMAAFELAERKILDDYTSKMKELQQAKQEFLSLPAPKAQDE